MDVLRFVLLLRILQQRQNFLTTKLGGNGSGGVGDDLSAVRTLDADLGAEYLRILIIRYKDSSIPYIPQASPLRSRRRHY
ncbi:hypothetical protein BofuT4_uP068160.1 [Botrytis cinerea T4]|uniref:Uncharacterized protein n=1 Tax=Botryotinia fuckeliana (strain T4) TaxID=999810 RepID=G2XQY3_BOTF4|nr:hypothetical protein BofuT4_uP068160.1 [Botrytis cinerea T4]